MIRSLFVGAWLLLSIYWLNIISIFRLDKMRCRCCEKIEIEIEIII